MDMYKKMWMDVDKMKWHIDNRRIYLNKEETESICNGESIDRIFKTGAGICQHTYKIKIIPNKKGLDGDEEET